MHIISQVMNCIQTNALKNSPETLNFIPTRVVYGGLWAVQIN